MHPVFGGKRYLKAGDIACRYVSAYARVWCLRLSVSGTEAGGGRGRNPNLFSRRLE